MIAGTKVIALSELSNSADTHLPRRKMTFRFMGCEAPFAYIFNNCVGFGLSMKLTPCLRPHLSDGSHCCDIDRLKIFHPSAHPGPVARTQAWISRSIFASLRRAWHPASRPGP